MQEYYDVLVVIVVIAAFVAGYLVVSYVFKFVRELNSRPPLNKEFLSQQAEAGKAYEFRQESKAQQDKSNKQDWENDAHGEEDRR
jgi:hypothetical protein